MSLRRREFIAGLGGAAAWPLSARAQQGDRVRQIGVLVPGDENDPVGKTFVSAFTKALADLGWTDGRNVRIDRRWAGADINRIRALAQELVGLQPDVILTTSTAGTVALQRETRTIPIVFANVGDPVASGLVARLDRPGGNVTGFATYEATLGGKWLELLSEIAPGLKRAAIMFNPDTTPVSTYLPSLEKAARSVKVGPITAPVRSDGEIEAAIIALGREPGGGLVVVPDTFMFTHRAPIISAAARNNVPAVYPRSTYARDGGLVSYGSDPVDLFRRATSYVDRILRGAKPAELPVQLPTKFEMIVNLKTAKARPCRTPIDSAGRRRGDRMIRRREFITLLGGGVAARGARAAGRAGTAHRRAHGGGATKTIPWRRLPFLRSLKRLRASVGTMAATCGWTFVGAAMTSIGYERSRRTWSACNPTSS
jgi:putative ABC transport system substrate-binding protein